MAVKIRLTRMGSKKRPSYRIVATDSRSPRDGKYIELIGFYNPITEPAEIKINEEGEIAKMFIYLGLDSSLEDFKYAISNENQIAIKKPLILGMLLKGKTMLFIMHIVTIPRLLIKQ